MKLTNQGVGAIMMALQKGLMEQSDVTEMIKDFNFVEVSGQLMIDNAPVINFTEFVEENDDEDEEPDNFPKLLIFGTSSDVRLFLPFVSEFFLLKNENLRLLSGCPQFPRELPEALLLLLFPRLLSYGQPKPLVPGLCCSLCCKSSTSSCVVNSVGNIVIVDIGPDATLLTLAVLLLLSRALVLCS